MKVCNKLKVPMQIVHLPFGSWGFKSALLSRDEAIPVGDYNEADMQKTIVPFRNGIMISIAVGIAVSRGYKTVYIGAHAGDHAIYSDCREEFLYSMQRTVLAGTDNEVCLARSFVKMSKVGIVRLGVELKAPMEMSYSCYNGAEVHCGGCATCRERKAAFKEAGVEDHTKYRA